jgi:hypothetical protein
MTSKPTRIAALVLLGACAARTPTPRAAQPTPAVTARIADGRVSPSMLELPSGGQITFVNHGDRQHQIYSSNCSELSSTVLEPGQSVVAVVGVGPKECNFQDLLAPAAMEYWGTVSVAAPRSRQSTIWYNPGTAGR